MSLTGIGCKESKAPSHPALLVKKHWGLPKTRKLGRVSGISPTCQLEGYRNDINTLERAVKERVFFVKENGTFVPPPQPKPGHFAAQLSQVDQLLTGLLPKSSPLSASGFAQTFRGRKKTIYENAVSSLYVNPVRKRDAKVKVFVKYEKTDFTRKADPVPRVISPRDPRYNVEVGRYLRPIEERIFDSLAGLYEGKRTVFKGMNASESGRRMFDLWSSFREPVAIGLDASRFDQHVSKDSLQWEHSQYLKCFPRAKDQRKLSRLLGWQLENDCTGYCEDGKLSYKKEGGRMSGDMNTSLGNCILMCCMIKQYSMDRGVRTLLANNGDDCVVFMEASDLARFSHNLDGWFRSMGFNMTVEKPVYVFEEIEFCQTHPVLGSSSPGDYIMVRHPKWAIAKDTCSVHGFNSTKEFKNWLGAVGEGGLSMTGAIPVFQDFYRCYVQAASGRKDKRYVQSWGVRSMQQGMKRCYGDIAPETRASFYWAFGVLPDEQRILEDFYRNFKITDIPEQDVRYAPIRAYDV